jgi:hypothetical protein
VRLNYVRSQKERFGYSKAIESLFVDAKRDLEWRGIAYVKQQNTTRDGGQSFKTEKPTVLFVANFYLQNDVLFYSFVAYNITMLLAGVGGFLATIFGILLIVI